MAQLEKGEHLYMRHVASGAVLVVNLLSNCQQPLLAAEQRLGLGVTEARLRELRAGRASARNALDVLGGDAAPILVTPSGAPSWPTGFCGSISHTARHVAALAALTSHYDSVGVDIDDGRPLGDASGDIATPEEFSLLESMGLAKGSSAAGCLVFCIKEAIFKCQCPLTGYVSLDFLEIHLEPGPSYGGIKFYVTGPDRPALTQLANRMEINCVNTNIFKVVYALIRAR